MPGRFAAQWGLGEDLFFRALQVNYSTQLVYLETFSWASWGNRDKRFRDQEDVTLVDRELVPAYKQSNY